MPLQAQERSIPLLISDNHADHMEFFFRYGEGSSAAMIVLDAHSDTVANEHSALIREYASQGDFSRADLFASNHNWIHPLVPSPLKSLAWISKIRGYTRGDKIQGYFNSISKWDSVFSPLFLSVEELRFFSFSGEMLFISVDLDFFYSEDHGPEDVDTVLDAIFSFSSRWPGLVVWAFCLSRPWLPDDAYAWNLLDRSLSWLRTRPEFRAPEITLFNSVRFDTSMTAEAFRAEGLEIPALKEADAPLHIKETLLELQSRK